MLSRPCLVAVPKHMHSGVSHCSFSSHLIPSHALSSLIMLSCAAYRSCLEVALTSLSESSLTIRVEMSVPSLITLLLSWWQLDARLYNLYFSLPPSLSLSLALSTLPCSLFFLNSLAFWLFWLPHQLFDSLLLEQERITQLL
jgi:hypothetical protein